MPLINLTVKHGQTREEATSTLNMRVDHGPCLDATCSGRIRDRRGEPGGAPMQCDRCGALYTR